LSWYRQGYSRTEPHTSLRFLFGRIMQVNRESKRATGWAGGLPSFPTASPLPPLDSHHPIYYLGLFTQFARHAIQKVGGSQWAGYLPLLAWRRDMRRYWPTAALQTGASRREVRITSRLGSPTSHKSARCGQGDDVCFRRPLVVQSPPKTCSEVGGTARLWQACSELKNATHHHFVDFHPIKRPASCMSASGSALEPGSPHRSSSARHISAHRLADVHRTIPTHLCRLFRSETFKRLVGSNIRQLKIRQLQPCLLKR
jgi:hypothetical protein